MGTPQSSHDIKAGRPPKKPYPVAKGVAPPPSQEESIVEEEPLRSRKTLFILIGIGLAVFMAIGLTLALGLFSSRTKLTAEEKANALENLKLAQKEWWDGEALSTAGCADAAGALENLRLKQREWWDSQSLASKGDDGTAALNQLAELQRTWWEKEGLAKGEPSKDPAGALGRLETINAQWFASQSIVKAAPASKTETVTEVAGESTFLDKDGKIQILDNEGTRRFLAVGGTEDSETAVQLGLEWLARTQQQDGSWLRNPNPRNRSGRGDVVGTAFGVWPFLARGETHKGSIESHQYSKVVENALKFLLAAQKPDGDLRGGQTMYVHGLATIVLCEAFNMTADPALREPCQKAIDFIIKAQDKKGGGWRYQPNTPGDLSVVSWQLMALKSGQMAGLNIPRETLEDAIRFLRQCASKQDDGYGYMRFGGGPPGAPRMTAAGMLCRQYLQSNDSISSERMTRGVQRLLAEPPRSDLKDMYYYYYATQVVFNIGGDSWAQWNPRMRDLLVANQNKSTNPELKGSWDAAGDRFCQPGGRVMATCLSLLTLEVYYRHSPLNRPDLGELNKDLNALKK